MQLVSRVTLSTSVNRMRGKTGLERFPRCNRTCLRRGQRLHRHTNWCLVRKQNGLVELDSAPDYDSRYGLIHDSVSLAADNRSSHTSILAPRDTSLNLIHSDPERLVARMPRGDFKRLDEDGAGF